MRPGMAIVGLVAIIGLAGCGEVTTTPTGTPTQTQTQTQTQTANVPAHGPVTRDVLVETPPWIKGSTALTPTFESELDAYAKAGPVHLILANLNVTNDRMREAGFNGRDTALWYALSRFINAGNTYPPPQGFDSEAAVLHEQGPQIIEWWQNYVAAVVRVMQKRSDLTVSIISNDDNEDKGGRSLANGTMRLFPDDVRGRVDMGAAVND
jgi:hypothetical protein